MNKHFINASHTRINKEIAPDILTIFKNEVGDLPYLNKEVRSNIITHWLNKYPNLNKGSLRVYLTRLEQKFFEEQPQWTQKSLINKITVEYEGLKERILTESAEDITKQSKAIKDLDELVAKVNKLTDASPAVSIIINSSINEDELTKSILNGKIFDAEYNESDEVSSEKVLDVEVNSDNEIL